jgi:hypothetical protein
MTEKRKRAYLILGLAFAAILLIVTIRSQIILTRERQWVAQAEAVAVLYLQSAPRDETFGDFKGLSGDGYHPPGWNINAPHLIAERVGHFARTDVPIRIYVWEPLADISGRKWTIQRVEKPGESGGSPMCIYVEMK